MKKILLSIFAVLFAFAGVQAQEVVYTLEPAEGTNSAYASNCDITIDGITWNLAGNSKMIPWRIGGKNLTNVDRALYSKTAMESAVSKVVLTTGTQNLSAINSAKLLVANNANFDGAVEYSFTFAASSDIEIPVSAAAGSYYKFVFNVSAGNSNKYLQFVRAKFYSAEGAGEGGGDTPALETLEKPVIAPDSQEFNLGESVTVAITAAEGATIYYTTDGNNPTEESNVYEEALTITETTTVKAFAVMDGYNNSAVAEAKYTAVDPNAKTATFDFTNPAGLTPSVPTTEISSSNGYPISEITFTNNGVTINTTNGSTPSRIWGTSAHDLRVYKNATMTIAAPAGGVLTSVEFTGSTVNNFSANIGELNGKVWTGSASSVVFTWAGGASTQKISTITVTYSIDESVVIIDQPSIAGEATFVGSTTVEITNNAEGTTLYYSTNGVDYDVYTTALNITETTTVYAKAVDAQGNESSVAEATFTKLETLSIAEAKAAYDNAGEDVAVAVDLTGAVVTVNSDQYLFIENETTGINIYNSGADYAVGTKFTSGYVLGTSTTYRNMHQLSNVEFCGVETTTTTVEPLEVTIADIAGNYAEYEGRFVKLTGVSIDADKNMTQGDDEYKAYDRFTLGFGAIANCDVTGVVAIYNTGEQLYIKDITYNLTVSDVEYATLFLDFAAAIPAGVEAYVVESAEGGYVDLVQVEGVLPANTGVVLKNTGDYTFTYSTETAATIETNLLLGTAVDTDIEVKAYVLSKQSEGVGFYMAKMTDGAWLNNANKAYLPASAVPAEVKSLSFRFPGTTGIEEVVGENANVKAIYDLTGRRVEAITAPGIYIVNGKKTLVK